MATKLKKLKALLDLQGVSDTGFIQKLLNVFQALNGNLKFPNPPVDLVNFKSGIDILSTLVTEAADGGKKAITAKNKQRDIMDGQYTQLGHYVEAVSNGDPATFATSGFLTAPTERVPPQPLPPASIDWIDRGSVTGSVVVKVKTVPKAIHYSLEYAVVTTPGTLPTSWTQITVPGSKKVTISNLAPGANYAFQVRAMGRLGYTDWSDPMTFICG